VPSLYHLSTLLETFIWLFHRVRQQVPVDDIRLQCLGQLFIVKNSFFIFKKGY